MLAGTAPVVVRAGAAAVVIVVVVIVVVVSVVVAVVVVAVTGAVPGAGTGSCCCCLSGSLGSACRCCSGLGRRQVAGGSGAAVPEGGLAVALAAGPSPGLLPGQAAWWAARAELVGNDPLQVRQMARFCSCCCRASLLASSLGGTDIPFGASGVVCVEGRMWVRALAVGDGGGDGGGDGDDGVEDGGGDGGGDVVRHDAMRRNVV